jgi:hypothetical protein
VAKRIQLAAVWAWNGLVGFYIPIGAFTIWIGVMTYYMHTGINRQFETGGDDETIDEPTQFTLDADHPTARARTGVS